jgi:hypothetical protein
MEKEIPKGEERLFILSGLHFLKKYHGLGSLFIKEAFHIDKSNLVFLMSKSGAFYGKLF